MGEVFSVMCLFQDTLSESSDSEKRKVYWLDEQLSTVLNLKGSRRGPGPIMSMDGHSDGVKDSESGFDLQLLHDSEFTKANFEQLNQKEICSDVAKKLSLGDDHACAQCELTTDHGYGTSCPTTDKCPPFCKPDQEKKQCI